MVGGDLEFIPDWDAMYARSLELIDAKRAALKLPAYDPAQFGDSGDSLFFAEIKKYLADKAAEAERGVETVGSPVYPLAEGHSHDHGDGHDAHAHARRGRGLMSRYIATRAIRGAQGIVGEAEEAVERGPRRARPRRLRSPSPTPPTTCR